MEALSCLTDLGPCLSAGLDTIVAMVPWWWVIGSVIFGAVLGASFGWLGVAAAVGGLLAFLGGRSTSRRDQARNPPPLPPVPKSRPKTLKDLFKR